MEIYTHPCNLLLSVQCIKTRKPKQYSTNTSRLFIRYYHHRHRRQDTEQGSMQADARPLPFTAAVYRLDNQSRYS